MTGDLPTVEAVTALIEKADDLLAGTLRKSHDVQITRLASPDDFRSPVGWRSESSQEIKAYAVTWSYESLTRGTQTRNATIIQNIEGGRSAGEGHAVLQQFVVPRHPLSREELEAVVRLVATNCLPVKVTEVDL